MTRPAWRYGDAWESFPIERGQVAKIGPHRVACLDLGDVRMDTLRAALGGRADLTYTDPPWGQGLLSAFATKARVKQATTWHVFLEALIFAASLARWEMALIEMGERWHKDLVAAAEASGGQVARVWPITYSSQGRPCTLSLVRWGTWDDPTGAPRWMPEFAGHRDRDTPGLLIDALPVVAAEGGPLRVWDLCCGLGTTAAAVVEAGEHFGGAELNPRRAANTIRRICALAGAEASDVIYAPIRC